MKLKKAGHFKNYINGIKFLVTDCRLIREKSRTTLP